jgi:hypothetical protein
VHLCVVERKATVSFVLHFSSVWIHVYALCASLG